MRPIMRASAVISAAGIPVMAAAHSGPRLARWASSSSGMVRIAGEVGAVGEVLGEEHVHDAAG